jgi:hypothetical protein
MNNRKSFVLAIFVGVALACLQTAALGQGASQSADSKAANVRAEGMGVRFDPTTSYSNGTLIISAPDGNVYRREFKGGSPLSFALLDKAGAPLGNGQYNYEIRLTTVQLGSRLTTASGDGGAVEDENGRTNRRPSSVQSVIQSGSFAVQNGALYLGNETEPTAGRRPVTKSFQQSTVPLSGNTVTRLRNHRVSLFSMPDQVIPDDLIVQGSACIGLDCVNNESFGFDTIRLKENNTRIKFDDTSTSAGFPNHDWQLTANDSASGGANKFSIEDITAATVPFTITGSAPNNAIFVDSSGRVGLRTSTPVLDLHTSTSNTPAHRYEQTNAGGFTAQTWDVAGNEANFFVRDVTGGSRLPFRIRPGAPTSSIDISATGAVGVGTASPAVQLHLVNSSTAQARVESTGNAAAVADFKNLSRRWVIGTGVLSAAGDFSLFDANASATRVFVDTSGNVGIGTSAPLQLLSVNGTAGKPGGGTWDVFSDERLKNIKGRYNTGLKALMQLQPIRYEYKRDNPLGIKSEGENVGFGAQTLQKIIPEAVTMNSAGYLMVKSDPILWTMLNAIKEQQKEIAELKGQVRKLQTASHRRRK